MCSLHNNFFLKSCPCILQIYLRIKIFNSFLFLKAGKKAAECVKVVIRCRPMNEKEIAAGHDRFESLNFLLFSVHFSLRV